MKTINKIVVLFFITSTGRAQVPCSNNTPVSASATTVNPSCVGGGSATISTSNGLAPYTYIWTPAVSTTNSAGNLSPGTYSVQVTDAGCHLLGQELVVNGNFSQGNTGFSSSYTYCNTSNCLFPPAMYAVGSNTTLFHPNFFGNDHTTGTGQFMIINGASTANVALWTETVNILPNTDYVFSTWLSSLNTISPSQLTFFINGVAVSSVFTSPLNINVWNQFCVQWNSGSNTTAVISIVNMSTIITGNDFGLDDISFKACYPSGDTVVFTINPYIPMIAQTSVSESCYTGSASVANVTGGTSPYTYLWSNGQTSATISGLAIGNYSVVVTDANGCVDTTTAIINALGASPLAAFSTASVCEGAATPLTNSSIAQLNDPITSWIWATPGANQTVSFVQNPSLVYNTAGSYTVSLIITTAAGCKDSVSNTLVVHQKPTVIFTGGASGCAPVCAQFIDASISTDGAVTNWQWNFPGGTPATSTQQNPNVCYLVPGTYGATLSVTNSFGCIDTQTIAPLINVHPFPDANFYAGESGTGISDPVFNFTHLWSADVTQFQWNFGDNSALNNSDVNPAHAYTTTVTGNDFYSFTVSLLVQNQFGCKDSITQLIHLSPYFAFYIPNVFTPNNDGDNEVFYGKGMGIKEYTIILYDRWGNFIWNCHQEGSNKLYDDDAHEGMSAACKWDGRYQGNLVQEDTYVWKVKLTDVFGLKKEYHGIVSVVR